MSSVDMKGRISGRLHVSWLLILIAGFGASIAQGKVRFFTLVEKVRQSEVVAIGTVAAVNESTFLLNTSRVLKGAPSGNSLEIEVPSGNMESPVPAIKPGDSLLVFVSKKDLRHAPFMGGQGLLKLESGWADLYTEAVKAILDYESASTPDEKRTQLATMLKGKNRLLHHAALWNYMYLEPNARKQGIAGDELLPTVEALAKGPDDSVAALATQVIGTSEGKKSVPILIGLVGDADAGAAEVASRILDQKTGRGHRVNRKQPKAERVRAMNEWKTWWNANKEKAKLRD